MEKITCYVSAVQQESLRKKALRRGLVVKRGSHRGEGSISKLLQQIAEGKLTIVKLGRP